MKFNYSQDIIDLQTKYSLFKRVLNILFSLTIDGGFDKELMTRSINLLIELAYPFLQKREGNPSDH